jgi:hypothetical protein
MVKTRQNKFPARRSGSATNLAEALDTPPKALNVQQHGKKQQRPYVVAAEDGCFVQVHWTAL